MAFQSNRLSAVAEPPTGEVDLAGSFSKETHQQMEKMVEDVLTDITKSRAFFREKDVINGVWKKAGKSVDAGTLKTEVMEHELFNDIVEFYVKKRPMVSIGETGNITTPEMVDKEKTMIALAGEETDDHVLQEGMVRHAIASKPQISEEQILAVEAACLSKRRVTVIEGTAGAGKSFTMEAVKQAYSNSGYDIMGTALSWNAAQVLGSSIKLDGCLALDTLIRTMAAATAGGTQFFRNPTLLIVDEAGMVGTHFMATLLAETAVSHQPVKVVLTGDSLQVNPVDAGNALQAIVEYHVTTRIDTIRRQNQESHRRAVKRFSQRHAGQALHTFIHQEAVHWSRDREAMINMVVRDFVSYRHAYPHKSALVLALANTDVVDINQRIRLIYRKLGFVGAKEVKADVTDGRRKWQAGFSIGDEVVLRSSGKQIVVYHIDNNVSMNDESQWSPSRKGVYNRNYGKIVGIRRSNDPVGSHDFIVDLAGDQPGRVIINSQRYKHQIGGMPMVHNFATTIYGSQGQTVDKVFMLDSPMMEFRLAYVGMSRHRESVEIYLDETEIHNRLDRDLQRTTPLGVKDPTPKFGEAPAEISVDLGRYSRSEMMQRVSLNWSRQSLNLTAMMFEKIKRLGEARPREDAELSKIEQADPSEPLLDFQAETNIRHAMIDVERVLELPDPIEEAELVRPSEVAERNVGQSLRVMPIRTTMDSTVTPMEPRGLLARALGLVFGAPPPPPRVPEPSLRHESPPAAFQAAPVVVAKQVKDIRKEVPVVALPAPIGVIRDDQLLFDGVPQTASAPGGETHQLSQQFMDSMRGRLWEAGRYEEPRILARDFSGQVMARYRLDGRCVVGEGYPPMLMNPTPNNTTPVVIVPGAREFFLVADSYRSRNPDDPARVPHVIWAAKDIDWKPIVNALRQQPVIIMRSKHDESQAEWALGVAKELRERWQVEVLIRPEIDPVVSQSPASPRRRGP
jgi:hypothetical protein